MKEPCRHVAALALALAGTASLLSAAESAERYAVVYQKDYKNQESYTIMSEYEYRAASQEALKEGKNLRKALTGARSEWLEKENKRVGKKSLADYLKQSGKQDKGKKKSNKATSAKTERTVPFPSLDVNMEPIVRCLAMCDSQEDAEVKRKAFEAQAEAHSQPLGGGPRVGENTAPSGLKRPPPRSKDTRGDGGPSDSDAMELFEKHLEEVRRGPTRASSDAKSAKTKSVEVRRLGEPIGSALK